MKLNTKYQGFRPCGFRQEDFFTFPYISLCKTCEEEVSFKSIVNGQRRTKTDHKSSPCHYVTGELKMGDGGV